MQHRTNVRAFYILSEPIDELDLSEQQEKEVELKNLDQRLLLIDELHLRIDNIIPGQEDKYKTEYTQVEKIYIIIKRQLNNKANLNSSFKAFSPQNRDTNFYAKPALFNSITETIHNNAFISKAQKMQYLKAKLKEKLSILFSTFISPPIIMTRLGKY